MANLATENFSFPALPGAASFLNVKIFTQTFAQGDPPAVAPVVDNFDPALATAILATRVLSFDVTLQEPSVSFSRIVVFVTFPFIGLYEVAHDGDAFAQSYPDALGNTRMDTLLDGTKYHFALQREGGWPASPRLAVLAICDDGAITNITSSIYGWTLV